MYDHVSRERTARTFEPPPTEPVLVRIKCTEVLFPGSTGKGTYSFYGPANQGLTELSDEIDIADYMHNCCLFPDEYAWGLQRADSGLVEIIGPVGLSRRAVADAEITFNSFGTVSIHHDSGDTGENVTGYLDWIHGDENVSANKRLRIEYFSKDQKWVIVDGECEA